MRATPIGKTPLSRYFATRVGVWRPWNASHTRWLMSQSRLCLEGPSVLAAWVAGGLSVPRDGLSAGRLPEAFGC